MINETYIGFMERMKIMSGMRMLGTGMDIGNMQPYGYQIAFSLILKVFRKQIQDDNSRTKKDLLEMTKQITKEMNVSVEKEEYILRLVEGVLWSDRNKQSHFESIIFNEKTNEYEVDKFKYFEEDFSDELWGKSPSTIYKLTTRAEQMIFITREIMEELEFDLEQFYTLQLIKNGYYKEAINSVVSLIGNVKRLINKEKQYSINIQRNPGIIISENRINRRKKKEEINKQFEEEQKMFKTMLRWKEHVAPEKEKQNVEKLFEDIEKARKYHDILAKTVLSNISYEIELRLKSPQSFWKLSNISFKKNYWEDEILKKGVGDFDIFEDLLTDLFSVEIPFIFPIDWAFSEQITTNKMMQEVREKENQQIEVPQKEIDWEKAIKQYMPIFEKLLVNKKLTYKELEKLIWDWEENVFLIDILMMFVLSDTKLKYIKEITNQSDIRLALFSKLCNEDQKYLELSGKKIVVKLNEDVNCLMGNKVKISPYELFLI